jgi:hypothetical protein
MIVVFPIWGRVGVGGWAGGMVEGQGQQQGWWVCGYGWEGGRKEALRMCEAKTNKYKGSVRGNKERERKKERERVSERSKRSEITARSGEWGFSPVAEVEPPAAGLGKGQGVRRGSGQLTELKPPAVVVVAAVASSA